MEHLCSNFRRTTLLLYCMTYIAMAIPPSCPGQGCAAGSEEDLDALKVSFLQTRMRVSSETNKTFSAWVADAPDECRRACGKPAQPRKVQCMNVFTKEILRESDCDSRKPLEALPCDCTEMPCDEEVVECDPDAAQLTKEDQGFAMDEYYEQVGCFMEDLPNFTDDESDTIHNLACMGWKSEMPCLSGVPFFRMTSNAQSPWLCFQFCLGKSLDVFALNSKGHCRCGASAVNENIWGGHSPSWLVFTPELLKPDNKCDLRVFRYAGHYDSGGLPLGLQDAHPLDEAYIDSILKGKLVSEESEEDKPEPEVIVPEDTEDALLIQLKDGGRHGANVPSESIQPKHCTTDPGKCTPEAFYTPEGLKTLGDCICTQEYKKITADPLIWKDYKLICSTCLWIRTWKRNCWPGNCGAAPLGPWPTRAPCENKAKWGHGDEDCVRIRFWFQEGMDNTRKEVARKMAREFSEHTCIQFKEVGFENREPPGIAIGKKYVDSCYMAGLGYPGDKRVSYMNLGSCKNMAKKGSVLHEFGHALGMTHHQQRPDALQTLDPDIQKSGPHLMIYWQAIDNIWHSQWAENRRSYVGSNDVGYSEYDFASIMHYQMTENRGVTFPLASNDLNLQLTGQRKALSDGDIREILDTYQCKRKS